MTWCHHWCCPDTATRFPSALGRHLSLRTARGVWPRAAPSRPSVAEHLHITGIVPSGARAGASHGPTEEGGVPGVGVPGGTFGKRLKAEAVPRSAGQHPGSQRPARPPRPVCKATCWAGVRGQALSRHRGGGPGGVGEGSTPGHSPLGELRAHTASQPPGQTLPEPRSLALGLCGRWPLYPALLSPGALGLLLCPLQMPGRGF